MMTFDERIEKLIEERGDLPLKELLDSEKIKCCISKSLADWILLQDYEGFYYTMALVYKIGYDVAKSEAIEEEFGQA